MVKFDQFMCGGAIEHMKVNSVNFLDSQIEQKMVAAMLLGFGATVRSPPDNLIESLAMR